MKLKDRIPPETMREMFRLAEGTMGRKAEDERERSAVALADRLAKRQKQILGETKDIDEKEGIVVALISTGDLDRDSEVVVPGAFKDSIPDFMKNPVVLWAHSHSEPPVGMAIEMEDTKDGLRSATKFAVKESPFAKMIFDLYAGEYLRAWSVGFIPKEYSEETVAEGQKGVTFLKAELFEYSAVPVPSNRGALTELVKGFQLSKSIVPASPAAAKAVKEGRVLSSKNRDKVEAAIAALRELLAADDASRENRSIAPAPTVRRDPKALEAIVDELIITTGGLLRRRR